MRKNKRWCQLWIESRQRYRWWLQELDSVQMFLMMFAAAQTRTNRVKSTTRAKEKSCSKNTRITKRQRREGTKMKINWVIVSLWSQYESKNCIGGFQRNLFRQKMIPKTSDSKFKIWTRTISSDLIQFTALCSTTRKKKRRS